MSQFFRDRTLRAKRVGLTFVLSICMIAPFVAADEKIGSTWFWPDPYPHLGHESIEGDGWMYLRIASDEEAAREVDLSDPQRQEMFRYYTAAQTQERELGRKRRAAGETDSATWTKQRGQLWQREADTASNLLSVEQDRRIKQLLLQRLSFNAFARDDVAEFVDLNDDQRSRIETAIDEHLQRLRAKDDKIDGLIKRLSGGLQGNLLQERVNELKALVDARGPFGRQSHQQVWRDIHGILSLEQREAFNNLRGSLPESALPRLQQFGS